MRSVESDGYQLSACRCCLATNAVARGGDRAPAAARVSSTRVWRNGCARTVGRRHVFGPLSEPCRCPTSRPRARRRAGSCLLVRRTAAALVPRPVKPAGSVSGFRLSSVGRAESVARVVRGGAPHLTSELCVRVLFPARFHAQVQVVLTPLGLWPTVRQSDSGLHAVGHEQRIAHRTVHGRALS
jgi:hypothetical protein